MKALSLCVLGLIVGMCFGAGVTELAHRKDAEPVEAEAPAIDYAALLAESEKNFDDQTAQVNQLQAQVDSFANIAKDQSVIMQEQSRRNKKLDLQLEDCIKMDTRLMQRLEELRNQRTE